MTKNKVVFWFYYYYTVQFKQFNDYPQGGVVTTLYGLSQALNQQGWDVTIFTCVPSKETHDGITLLPLHEFPDYSQKQPIQYFISLGDLYPFTLNFSAQLKILDTGYPPDSTIINSLFSVDITLNNQPLILKSGSLADFMPFIDVVVVKSEWQKTEYQKRFNLDPQKLMIIPCGIFEDMYTDLDFKKKDPDQLIFSGSLSRGLDVLFSIFPEIKKRHPATKLWVAAGQEIQFLLNQKTLKAYQDLYNHFIRLAKELDIQFLGALSRNELVRYLLKSSIWVNPTYVQETFSTCGLEAQTAGLAVVTTNNGAFKTRLQHGFDAILVDGDARSPEYQAGFIDQTLRLLKNPDLRTKIAKNAQHNKLQAYSWTQLASTLVDVFKQFRRSTDHPSFNGDYLKFSDRQNNLVALSPSQRSQIIRFAHHQLSLDRFKKNYSEWTAYVEHKN